MCNKNIGFLMGIPSLGGGERILFTLVNSLLTKGYNISIYSWEKGWVTYKKDIAFELHLLNEPPIGLYGKYRAVAELLRELKKHDRLDCFVIFNLALAEIGVFPAKKLKIPVLLSERVDPWHLPQNKIHRLLRRILYSVADGVVFQTKAVQSYFGGKGKIIPNPIMDDNLPYVLPENRSKEIVAVGRLSEEKNFEMLIKAFSKLAMLDYKLIIYGDGPLRSDICSLIERLSLSDRVILKGKVQRVVDYISNADIFVMSSNYEGMPNALIEAMALGIPSISTDFRSGAAKELINNGENGLLIPINDLEALHQALTTLLSDDELKYRLGRNALKIRQSNNKNMIIEKWIDYISQITH